MPLLGVPSTCKQMKPSNALFVKSICVATVIKFPKLGMTISRNQLTWAIVVFDMLICLLFAANHFWLQVFIRKRAEEVDREAIQITDFAVQIKRLPGTCNSLLAKRIELESRIKSIIKSQGQVIQALSPPMASDLEKEDGVPAGYDHS